MATSGSVNTSSYQGRYYQVSWSASQSVASNTSTISWTLKAAGGSSSWYAERTLSVVIAGNTVYNKTARVERYAGDIASGTVPINHDSAGKASFSISIQAAVYVSAVNCTGSASFTLDTIPRASSLTASNGTLGTAQTLAITRADSSFKHKIAYSCGSASGYAAGDASSFTTETSISFTPPLSLASQNTTGTSVSVVLTLYTYTGDGSQIGVASKTISCAIPSSVKPSCSVAVSDSTGYADTYGGYIKGLSKLEITITGTTAYDSPIASYKTTANGSTYTSASFTTAALKTIGDQTISTTVTDKRGRSGSASKSITVLDYTAPSISKLAVGRCDSDGTANDQGEYVKVTYSYRVTPLSELNTATAKLGYKKSAETEYTEVELGSSYSAANASYIFAADTGFSYDVVLSVSDVFRATERSTSASTAFTLMHFKADGTGIGIGKISENSNMLEIGLETRFHKPIEAAKSLNVRVLGKRILIPENADLNDYITIGCYACASNSIVATLSNCPEQTAFTLDVYNANGGYTTGKPSVEGAWYYFIQELTTYTGDKYIRTVSFEGTTTPIFSVWYLMLSTACTADYVSSRGTSGIWTYEKWNSGKAVCWGKKNFGTVDCKTSWGSIYHSNTALKESFPSGFFSEAPYHFDVSVLYSGGSAVGILRGSTALTSSSTGNIYLLSPVSSSRDNVTLSMYAIGKWK